MSLPLSENITERPQTLGINSNTLAKTTVGIVAATVALAAIGALVTGILGHTGVILSLKGVASASLIGTGTAAIPIDAFITLVAWCIYSAKQTKKRNAYNDEELCTQNDLGGESNSSGQLHHATYSIETTEVSRRQQLDEQGISYCDWYTDRTFGLLGGDAQANDQFQIVCKDYRINGTFSGWNVVVTPNDDMGISTTIQIIYPKSLQLRPFLRNNTLIYCNEDGDICERDLTNDQIRSICTPKPNQIVSLLKCYDNTLIVGYRSGLVEFRKLNNGKILKHFKAHKYRIYDVIIDEQAKKITTLSAYPKRLVLIEPNPSYEIKQWHLY